MANQGVEPGKRPTAVSNAITKLHREHYGRGAVTARAVIQRNYVIVFLEDIYTPLERTLIEAGRLETVKETRQAFQMTMRERFSAAVEQNDDQTLLLLRRVR